jgi:hypothetical protein
VPPHEHYPPKTYGRILAPGLSALDPICPKKSRRGAVSVPPGVVSRELSTTPCRRNWLPHELDRFVNFFATKWT